MKKLFSKIHLWLSIPLGIIITLICLTGALLVFRTEIEEATHPELYFIQEKTDRKLPLSELLPLVDAQLGDISVTSVSVDSDSSRNYIVSTNEGHRTSVYVNPYTGQVVGKSISNGFFSQMLQLHRWLMIDREIGKPIVGYTTLLLVLILISGIFICFPKSQKQLKRIFTIRLDKGWKHFWYDLHVSGGAYVLIGLLVLSLTGLTWSFPWYRDSFYKLFGAEVPQGVSHGVPQAQTAHPFSGAGAHDRADSLHSVEKESGRIRRPDRSFTPVAQGSDSIPLQESTGKTENPDFSASVAQAETDPSENRKSPRGNSPQTSDNPESRHRQDRKGVSKERNRDSSKKNHGKPTERETPPARSEAEPLHILHWDNLLVTIQKNNPDYKRITLRNHTATVTLHQLFGNSRASDRYSFDGNTGKITEHVLYKDSERSTKVRGWIYSIHVGSWGGLFSKIITCLVSLLGATLPVTGYYLWIKRLLRKKKSQQGKKI